MFHSAINRPTEAQDLGHPLLALVQNSSAGAISTEPLGCVDRVYKCLHAPPKSDAASIQLHHCLALREVVVPSDLELPAALWNERFVNLRRS